MTTANPGGFQFTPPTGLLDAASYPTTPVNETAARQQFMDLFYQLLNEINTPTTAAAAYGQYNKLINGNFDVWQRWTSSSSAGYTADRWFSFIQANATFTKQTATPPVGSAAYARATFNVLGGFLNFSQPLDSDDCKKIKGKTVSMSILMRRDATYDGQYQLYIEKNGTADTSSGGAWTTILTSAAFTLTTAWALYKLENVVIPNDASSNGIRVSIVTTGGTRPANSYVEFAQAQMNIGTLALPFQPKKDTQEIIDTLHYRWQSWTDSVVSPAVGSITGYALTSNSLVLNARFPVPMRGTPTVTIQNNNVANQVRNSSTGAVVAATLSTTSGASNKGLSILVFTGTPFTVGQYYDLDVVADIEI